MARLLSEHSISHSRGTYQDVSVLNYPSNAVAELYNGRIQPDGTISRREGTVRKHPSAIDSGTGYGATWFTTAAGTSQIVVFIDAACWVSSDGGATWTDVTGANILANGFYDFAFMRVGSTNWLFAANGDTSIWRWNGTALSALPAAPSGVKHIEVFNDRLYATGHSGVIVQASAIADPTLWATADGGITLQVQTHDGDTPTGLYQIGPHLLVFDEQATSYIDGFGQQDIIIANGATGFSRSVGCVGFRTIAGVGDNAACWLSHRGVEHYSPGSGITLLSRPVQRFMDSLDHGEIADNPGLATAAYDELSQEYHLACSTVGSRNNRTLVVNLMHRGQGWLGASAIDRQLTTSFQFLTSDADGYETLATSGSELRSDASGYERLTSEEGAEPLTEGANGYESLGVSDALPDTLFVGPSATRTEAIHSLGRDGFVREHYGTNDDELSDGTGGADVSMSVVSRPMLFGKARQRKRVRVLHVASINDADATLSVGLRVDGRTLPTQDVTIESTLFNQPKRKRVMTSGIGDAPQIEITTSDRVRIALIGADAELLREPTG